MTKMNERLEFSKDFDEPIYTTDYKTKREMSAEIAKHTEEYLANGGTITYLPYDWKAEMVGRVGYWKPMGDPTDEEIGADDDYETYS